VFYQGSVEEARSDFEIRDRVQLTLSREFRFFENARTEISLYYEGRSGNPYSWVYSSDVNGDGRFDNDLIAVPTGPDDPRFNFSTLTTAGTLNSYLEFMETSGLSRYSGSYAPRNAFF